VRGLTSGTRRTLAAAVLLVVGLAASAAAASGIEKSFEVSPGGRLEVQSEGASVTISTHDGDGARVVVTRGWDSETEIRRDFRVDFSQDGGTLRVELERLRDDLTTCIGCGCLSLQTCKLFNPNDEAAANGAGPRYLLGDDRDEVAGHQV